MSVRISEREYQRLSDVPATAPEKPQERRSPRKRQNGTRAPAAPPTEHAEQCALIAFCESLAPAVPPLALLLAVPNGGRRDAVTGARLRAEGVRAGVPDLLLPVARGHYHGLWVEMKRLDGGRVAPEQRRWHAALAAEGYAVIVCRGWAAAVRAILDYLGLCAEDYGLTD